MPKIKRKGRVKAPKGGHHVKTLRVHVTRAARESALQGFTLIELLVVIAVIGLLATLSVIALSNARDKSRDSKRLADVEQLQTSLDLYHDEAGHYPSPDEFNSGSIAFYSSNLGTTSYLKVVSIAPALNDGPCSVSGNTYYYAPTSDGSSYILFFCLGGRSDNLASARPF